MNFKCSLLDVRYDVVINGILYIVVYFVEQLFDV